MHISLRWCAALFLVASGTACSSLLPQSRCESSGDCSGGSECVDARCQPAGSGTSSSGSMVASGTSAGASSAGVSGSASGASSNASNSGGMSGASASASSGGATSSMGSSSGGMSSSRPNPTNANDAVRLALEPYCIGCHGAGTNRPFFASLQAFETLLVYNPAYVVPGSAAQSLLMALLNGTGTGTYLQMPPSGTPYASRPDITMSIMEIEAWINGLGMQMPVDAVADPGATRIRRMTAETILKNLYLQLGLTEVDFCATYYQCADLAAIPNDGAGPRPYMISDTFQRFEALGGPNWLLHKPRNNTFSPAFLQTFTQVSQAWCRRAVEKTMDNTILQGVTLADRSATSGPAIQQNIRRLFLRMLADPATAEEERILFEDVFKAHETVDTTTAWTAVCAAIVRHPKWLMF